MESDIFVLSTYSTGYSNDLLLRFAFIITPSTSLFMQLSFLANQDICVYAHISSVTDSHFPYQYVSYFILYKSNEYLYSSR